MSKKDSKLWFTTNDYFSIWFDKKVKWLILLTKSNFKDCHEDKNIENLKSYRKTTIWDKFVYTSHINNGHKIREELC